MRDVSHAVGDRELFTNIELALHPGQRLGLVGHNGSGKSSLLALLARRSAPDRGEVIWRNGLRLAEVEQFLPEGLGDVDLVHAVVGSVQGAQGIEQWQAEAILDRLGFSSAQTTQSVASLSGGQLKPSALCPRAGYRARGAAAR